MNFPDTYCNTLGTERWRNRQSRKWKCDEKTKEKEGVSDVKNARGDSEESLVDMAAEQNNSLEEELKNLQREMCDTGKDRPNFNLLTKLYL